MSLSKVVRHHTAGLFHSQWYTHNEQGGWNNKVLHLRLKSTDSWLLYYSWWTKWLFQQENYPKNRFKVSTWTVLITVVEYSVRLCYIKRCCRFSSRGICANINEGLCVYLSLYVQFWPFVYKINFIINKYLDTQVYFNNKSVICSRMICLWSEMISMTLLPMMS